MLSDEARTRWCPKVAGGRPATRADGSGQERAWRDNACPAWIRLRSVRMQPGSRLLIVSASANTLRAIAVSV